MIPVSSVSASVKRLENELGCKLFDRSHNRISLNRNGIRLQQALSLVFTELNKAVEDLSVPDSDNREIKMLFRAMRSDITEYISFNIIKNILEWYSRRFLTLKKQNGRITI